MGFRNKLSEDEQKMSSAEVETGRKNDPWESLQTHNMLAFRNRILEDKQMISCRRVNKDRKNDNMNN